MKNKIFKNYIFNSLYQIVNVISPLILVPFLNRRLGADAQGINATISSIVQWFAIFGIMGIQAYGGRKIAMVRDDQNDLNKTFIEIYFMQVLNILLVMIIYFVVVIFINIDKFDLYNYKIIFLIQTLTLVSVGFDITWLFNGVENFKAASIRNITVKIVGMIFIFMFIRTPNDLIKFVLINSVFAVLGQTIMWIQVPKIITEFKFPKFSGVYDHFIPNIHYFIPTLATSVYVVLDQTMLGLMSDPKNASFYQQSQRIVKMFLFFITSIGTVMVPRLSNIFAKGEIGTVKQYVNKTLKIALFLSFPMMFGLMAVGPHLEWYFSEEYKIACELIAFSSPLILFISLSDVFGIQYLTSVGKINVMRNTVLIGAVVNLVLNTLLIPRYGAYGAAIGSMGAEFVITAIQFMFVRKLLDFKGVSSSFIKYLIFGLVMYLGASYITLLMEPGIMMTLIQIFVGMVIYFTLIVLSRDNLFFELQSRLIKKT